MAIETAVLGGGCFWCLEAPFQQLRGVQRVTSGYAGGHDPKPDYDKVCTGRTGHAEVIEVEFDSSEITYSELLDLFFMLHDPTTLNRQGHDVGTQYRSIILYNNDHQRAQAEARIRELENDRVFENPVVTEIKPLEAFHAAEEYHQDFYRKNPGNMYCEINIAPKLRKVRQAGYER